MAITHVYSDAQTLDTTKVLPLSSYTGADRTAFVLVTSRGSAQGTETLTGMTGWTEVLNLGTGDAANGNRPRMWIYSMAIPDGTSDFTLTHSGTGGWVLVIVNGDLKTPDTGYEFNYGSSMSITKPGNSGETGVLIGACGTNANATYTSLPYTGVASNKAYWSNPDGSYSIETHAGGSTTAFTYASSTDYTLGWIWVEENDAPVTPVEGATVETGISTEDGMVVESGSETRTTTWTFSSSPSSVDISATLDDIGNLPAAEGGEVYVKVLDGTDDSVIVAEQKLGDVIGGEPAATFTATLDVSGDSATDMDVVYRVTRDLAATIRPPQGVGAGESGPIQIGNFATADYWDLLSMDSKVGATEKWVNYSTGSDSNAGTEGAPYKTIGHACSVLNGSTGTIWLSGTHPDVGFLSNIKGQDRDNIIAIRGLEGTTPRIESTAENANAIDLDGTFGHIAFYGITFEHLTYRTQAQNWGQSRYNFAIGMSGAYAAPGYGGGDYETNLGKVWILNCAAIGFGHGFGGEGVPSHIIAGNYVTECGYWVTGGGSGISCTRMGGYSNNTWGSWNYASESWTNGLNWDLDPIFTAPDGTHYQYVQMGNVVYSNRQRMASIGIGHNYQTDGNGLIFGDAELSRGRCLQTLNVSFRNGGQGLNTYSPPLDGVDVVLNTAWNNGYHWIDGEPIDKSGLWTNEMTIGSPTSEYPSTSIIGNLAHAESYQNAAYATYGTQNLTATQNYSSGKGGAGSTVISNIGIVSRTDNINTADPNLTAGSQARGKVSASQRKTAWDFNGATMPTSGMIDAGACQYSA